MNEPIYVFHAGALRTCYWTWTPSDSWLALTTSEVAYIRASGANWLAQALNQWGRKQMAIAIDRQSIEKDADALARYLAIAGDNQPSLRRLEQKLREFILYIQSRWERDLVLTIEYKAG
jgi:hypothetical protein